LSYSNRYAFDLSQFGGTPTVVKYSVRERYLWQLISPDTEDPLYKEAPGTIPRRAARTLLAPLYPFRLRPDSPLRSWARRAPRGQSAAWSLGAVILSVAWLRLIGFTCTVLTVKYPVAALVQYTAVFGAMAASLYAISRRV
jgi:lipopolysaccharide export system permease protein